MTFLRLNGWRIPAGIKTRPGKSLAHHGLMGDRFHGRPSRERQGIERSWSLKTTKLDEYCADTLEGLLEGRNHHFPFVVDVWSDSGLGPDSGSAWTLNSSGGPVATRGHYVTVNTGDLTYSAEFIDDPIAPDGGRWTVIWWELVSGDWVRRAMRSDGTKFENGSSAATPFTTLSVSAGSVTFLDGAGIADLVLLSFFACDDYLSAEYEWVSGFEQRLSFPFDNSYSDLLQGNNPTITGSIPFAKGQVRRAIVSTDGDFLNYGTIGDAAAFNNPDGFSVRFWLRIDDTPSVIARVISHLDPAFTDGWYVDVVPVVASTSYNITHNVIQATTSADATTSTLNVGTTYHVVVTYANNVCRVYVNGVLDSPSSTTGAGAVSNDTAQALHMLDNAASTRGTDGLIDEVAFHARELTAAEVLRIYNVERTGRPYPGPRFSSPLPRLEMFGDIDGAREPVHVVGQVEGEDYVQHGSSTGWVNNAREMSIKLHQVRAGRPDGVPRPDLGVEFSSEGIRSPGALNSLPEPFAGAYTFAATGFDMTNRTQDGPFGWPDQAFTFSGDYGRINDANFSNFLQGASGATILAWVRATSLASDGRVFDIPIDNSANERFSLRMYGTSGAYAIFCRSEAADALKIATGTDDLVANQWQLIGGVVDLEGDLIQPYSNGLADGVPTLALGFGEIRFSDEKPTVTPYAAIGETVDNTESWTGQIAGVYVWRRRLSAGEILSVYEAGKRGIFS